MTGLDVVLVFMSPLLGEIKKSFKSRKCSFCHFISQITNVYCWLCLVNTSRKHWMLQKLFLLFFPSSFFSRPAVFLFYFFYLFIKTVDKTVKATIWKSVAVNEWQMLKVSWFSTSWDRIEHARTCLDTRDVNCKNLVVLCWNRNFW